jgi:hypothetical protein
MKKLFLIFFLFPLFAVAQISDDFEDGDPAGWSENNPGHFAVTDIAPLGGTYSLQHSFLTDVTDNYLDIISIPAGSLVPELGVMTWEFQVKYDNTNPSGSNKWNVFLYADNDISSGDISAVNGYVFGLNFGSITDDALYLRKVTNGAGSAVINTGFVWNASAAIGVRITRSSAGDWEVFIDSDGGFDNLVSMGSGTDAQHTNVNSFGLVYDFTKTYCQKIWMDDVLITGPQRDEDSQVTAGPASSPASISSLETSPDGLAVLDVSFEDLGTSDGLATVIDSLNFTPGTANEVVDWQSVIAGAKLIGPDLTGAEATISPDGISFSGDNLITIADGTSETYELRIWLNTDLTAMNDNEVFDFRLDYTDITCANSGSFFGSGQIESGAVATDIQASEIKFLKVPPMVEQNAEFSLKVAAVDANGNIDLDETAQISLSLASGTGNLTSAAGLTQNFTAGQAVWNDLIYDEKGMFSISAEAAGFTAITSPEIESADFVYQLYDDFEDGDIAGWQETATGRWAASEENPINGSYSLRQVYDNSESDIDVIAHPLTAVDLASETKVWRFQLRFENPNPSSSNFWSVFLMSDADETAMKAGDPMNAYVLGINYNSSDDLLKLWEITDGTVSELITTDYNWEQADASTAKGFEISRTPAGEWEIKMDTNGGFESLNSYGTAVHAAHTQADYFGVYYKYSSTLDLQLTVDDLYLGPVIPDTIPPQVSEIIAVSPTELMLYFTEELDVTTAEDPANYLANNSIGNPVTALLNADNKSVLLTFSSDFQNGLENNLFVDNVEDLNGNALSGESHSFIWEAIQVQKLKVLSANELLVKYSKLPDTLSVSDISNYALDNGPGNPEHVFIQENDSSTVRLIFAQSFENEQSYVLNIQNIQDRYGNIMPETNLPFSYYVPVAYDLVINEIMCDVNPEPEALPSGKYLELYNRSDFDIDLTDWTLGIGENSSKIFPELKITSGEYLIISSSETASEFEAYGKTVPILTESHLTVSGTSVFLYDSQGNMIDVVEYSDHWYNDSDKDDGGWSLERIDYDNLCGTNDNWAASENIAGGTPGQTNSIYASNPDNTVPQILSVELLSSKELLVNFSEMPNYEDAKILENYTLNSEMHPVNAFVGENDIRLVRLVFENNFPEGENTLAVQNVSDPCGNTMADFSSSFNYKLIFPEYVQAVSDTQLKVFFSEKPSAETAQNPENYTVDQSIGTALIAQLSNSNERVVLVQFPESFIETNEYTLSVENVEDVNNNAMRSAELSFVYYRPKAFDVVFTEIMSDVSPAPEALPAVKYLELYNASDYSVDLTDWTFKSDGQTEKVFPSVILESNDYIVLAEEAVEYGDAPVLDMLAGSDLSISGKLLQIYDNAGTLIHELEYSEDWYGDSDKADGGWSLEVIDPLTVCQPENNWKPSEDPTGGTPGRTNSVNDFNPDTEIPVWEALRVVSSNTLELQFSEALRSESLIAENFSINETIKPSAVYKTNDRSVIRIEFTEQFQDNTSYELTIENIGDNCGNYIDSEKKTFTYHRIHIKDISIERNDHILIQFSELPAIETATDTLNYELTPSLGHPDMAYVNSEDSALLNIIFEEPMPQDEELTLSLANIYDRNGNLMPDFDTTFVYREAGHGDLVINEVLFNPYSGGTDFVELYNRSDYAVNLKHLHLSRRSDDGALEQFISLSNEHFYMQPGEYLAFTDGKELILRDYYSENEENIVELAGFPTYTNTSSTVVLTGLNDTIIDEFTYHEDMHFPLLADVKGVSLERIDVDALTQEESNWHSASETVGFATPAYKNSQAMGEFDDEDSEVWLEPEIFSPDHDGKDDYLMIHYAFKESGNTATVIVFNSEGREMRILENNTLLSAEGSIKWDGLFENGNKMRPGIYMIYFKTFKTDGSIKVFKKVVTLAVKY